MSGTIWREDMMNNSGLTVSIKFDIQISKQFNEIGIESIN